MQPLCRIHTTVFFVERYGQKWIKQWRADARTPSFEMVMNVGDSPDTQPRGYDFAGRTLAFKSQLSPARVGAASAFDRCSTFGMFVMITGVTRDLAVV